MPQRLLMIFKYSETLGFEARELKHNWQALQEASKQYIKKLNGMYRRNLSQKNIDIITGRASFQNAKEINVGGEALTAKQIIVACGATPTVPDIPGAELGITSDDFFELKNRPNKTIIVGSGYIAVELSWHTQCFGLRRHIVGKKEQYSEKV